MPVPLKLALSLLDSPKVRIGGRTRVARLFVPTGARAATIAISRRSREAGRRNARGGKTS